MHPLAATLVLAIFGLVANATPVASDASSIAASSPLVVHPDITLPRNFGLQADATKPIFPATFDFCSDFVCGTSCESFDLSTIAPGVCVAGPAQIGSVIIRQPSNAGLPFGVSIGPPDCSGTNFIPTVNTCVKVNSAADFIFTFVIIDP